MSGRREDGWTGQAIALWEFAEKDLERDGSSGVFGAACLSGARSILAIEAMHRDGVDVLKYLDGAQEKLSKGPEQ